MSVCRCGWVTQDPEYMYYHDHEWGVPVHDEDHMFEFLLLETFQAGLNWLTILKRRDNFRNAFDGFNARRIAAYTEEDVQRLMSNNGIIRNRRKILAAIVNAKATIKLRDTSGGLCEYLWSFVGTQPLQPNYGTDAEVPAQTELSKLIAKDMKVRGFQFVGPIVMYAHLQASGCTNDHISSCFRHKELS